MPPASEAPKQGQRVALFVTCLVDLHRPTVGFAAIKPAEFVIIRIQQIAGQIPT